jgi:hypothetical protein
VTEWEGMDEIWGRREKKKEEPKRKRTAKNMQGGAYAQ